MCLIYECHKSKNKYLVDNFMIKSTYKVSKKKRKKVIFTRCKIHTDSLFTVSITVTNNCKCYYYLMLIKFQSVQIQNCARESRKICEV